MKLPKNNYYKKIRTAIRVVVDYLYEEKKNYEEWKYDHPDEPAKEHIWHSIEILEEALDE